MHVLETLVFKWDPYWCYTITFSISSIVCIV